MRGRILALMPKHMVAMGVEKAKATIAGASELPLSQRVLKMAEVFKTRYGIGVEHLEAYIGHKLDAITMDEFVDLQGVFNALKEGAKASEYFSLEEQAKTQAAAAATAGITKLPPAAPPPAAAPAADHAPVTAPPPARAQKAAPSPKSTPAEAPKPPAEAKQKPAEKEESNHNETGDDRPSPPDGQDMF